LPPYRPQAALVNLFTFVAVWLAKLLAVMASFILNFSLSHFVVFRVRRALPATT
jgi:putative flippase GtrA